MTLTPSEAAGWSCMCQSVAHSQNTLRGGVNGVRGCGRLERFQAKACPGLDPGWAPVRVKKTRQNKNQELGSDFNQNRKGSSRADRKSVGSPARAWRRAH